MRGYDIVVVPDLPVLYIIDGTIIFLSPEAVKRLVEVD